MDGRRKTVVKYVRRSAWHRQMWHVPDAPVELCQALWQRPETGQWHVRRLKDGNRTSVDELCIGDARLALKSYRLRGIGHTAVHAFMRSRASAYWRAARLLCHGGIRTPRVIAVIEDRFGPLRVRSHLVSEFIAGATLLDLVGGQSNAELLEGIASQMAQIWRSLGQLRLTHGDMKASNFIVDAQSKVWLVDIESMRRPMRAVYARGRRKDYDRFMRNWKDLPEVADLFRDRFDTP